MTTSPPHRSEAQEFYAHLKSDARSIEARYRELTPGSARLAAAARDILPGGSTRDALIRVPHGPYVVNGKGDTLIDVDGRELVDLWFNATALPLGHADPDVVATVTRQLTKGTAFFAATESEIDLAREIAVRLPTAERVLFANSGSEAVMLAVRLARAFTGRDIVAKFEGSYHGSYDDVSWSVGPPPEAIGPTGRPHPVAASAGLPSGADRVLVLPFNDPEAAAARIEEQPDRIAAILVEPFTNQMGLTWARPAFLSGLRELCDRHGILLIFDEVMAFRVGYHGAQGETETTPDLTTLGKIIGGGFPVGAVVGRADIMAMAEPHRSRRVSHYGTFNANPITMMAGKATLDALTPAVFGMLASAGERIRTQLRRICEGLPIQITGAGSVFKITATPHELVDYRAMLTADRQWQEIVSLELLNRGFLLSTQLRGCVATATTDEHIDAFLDAVHAIVRRAD